MRHRFVLVLAWAHVPALAAVGLLLGSPVSEVAIASLTLIALATVGAVARNRALAAAAVALALITSSGVLVYLTDGVAAAHLHFFLVITAVSFYRDWRILAVAASYAIAYQFSAGLVAMTERPMHRAFSASLRPMLPKPTIPSVWPSIRRSFGPACNW